MNEYAPEVAERGGRYCPQALGIGAVQYADFLPKNPLYRAEQEAQLAAVRSDMAGLAHPNDEELLYYADAVRNNFRDTAGYIPPSIGNEADMKADILEWIQIASDGPLLAFLQRNAARLAAAQDILEVARPSLRDYARESMALLVHTLNFAPPHAEDWLADSLRWEKVRALDSFSAGRLSCNGYYDYEDGRYIGLWEDVIRQGGKLREDVYFHEHLHAAAIEAGADLRKLLSDDEELDFCWFNEAFVTHQVQVARSNDPETVIPEFRSDENFGSYYDQLTLVGLLLTFGAMPVSTHEVMQAYWERENTSPGSHRANLRTKLTDSFASLFPELEEGLVMTITREYNQAVSPPTKRIVLQKWIDEITTRAAPENMSATLEPMTARADLRIEFGMVLS